MKRVYKYGQPLMLSTTATLHMKQKQQCRHVRCAESTGSKNFREVKKVNSNAKQRNRCYLIIQTTTTVHASS